MYSHQYGFRPKHDTSQPLIQFLDKIFEGINEGKLDYTIAIFLKLKKAFNIVDFVILLEETYSLRVQG